MHADRGSARGAVNPARSRVGLRRAVGQPRRALRQRAAGRAGRTGWGVALAVLLLLTGCASMPDESGVSKVSESPRADGESQVRVFGVKPQPNDDALSLVRGFLEATTSDEADYRTARLYLTKQRARNWDPFAGITVLSDSPSPHGVTDPADKENFRVDLSGTRVGWVDKKHAYAPSEGAYEATFRLAKENGEWRISGLPDGLVLSHADFQRIYRSVNLYYFAATTAPGQNVVVPDPVYLRRRIEPLGSVVEALLDGPTDWLAPVVVSKFPGGTTLADREGLELTESGKLRVRLSVQSVAVPAQCEQMAAQLLRTVQEQAATKVREVEIAREDETTLCAVTGKDADLYSPQRLVPAADRQYLIDKQHQLATLENGKDQAQPVPGPFGEVDAEVQLRSVAVRPDGQAAAGVQLDGTRLFVADLAAGADLGEARLVSRAKKAQDRLSPPSWDGLGDLWVADRDPRNPRLFVLRDGKTITADVPELEGGRIQSVRLAPDGARIALLVKKGDRTTLQMGRVERGGTDDRPEITVAQLRSIAPLLEDVGAVSWAGLNRILVVGRESQGVQQMRYVDTDGSMPFARTLPGISKVEAVAASPDEAQPLLADSEDGIFRLPPDGNWKRVASDGSSPVYPG